MGIQAVQTNSTQTSDRFICPPLSFGDTTKYPINKCDAVAYAGYYLPNFTFSSIANTYPGYTNSIHQWKIGDSTSAFNWLKQEYYDPPVTSFTRQQPLKDYETIFGPFWKSQCNTYTPANPQGVELYEYEGGQGVPGPANINGGFPAVDPGSGDTITVANVQNYFYAFLQSQQMADLMTKHLSGFVTIIGGKFPAQFSVAGPWLTTAVWPSYRLNAYTNPTPTLQYNALLAFNG
jgi:hypothetical protein